MTARSIFTAGAVAIAAVVIPVICPIAPRFLWNATASAPEGLYRVHPVARPDHGMMVAIRPPADVAGFAARRHYLPLGVPLIKWVSAIDGDVVCRTGPAITVDGVVIGRALARDRNGRPLPVWQGCRRLVEGEIFVMNATVPDSFDGRYFGIWHTSQIVGRVSPIWTRNPHPRPRTYDEGDWK